MTTDPFFITGPALVSFSGGRTSAYMLWRTLQAHGGTLPDDVHVTFANTGKEREETLRFVQECGDHWSVPIHWLEFRGRRKDEPFATVDFATASREGEPFAALIRSKGYTPNALMRFCTIELKIWVMRDFARSLGWKHWTNVIGLRFDEGHRVLKSRARSESGKEPWVNAMPLADARVTVRDVRAFWNDQNFDLGLKSYEGNCDLCFLKARAKLEAIIREQPGSADWWAEQERVGKGRFITEYSYADLARSVAAQPHLFDRLEDDGASDAECGDVCGGDTPAEIAALQVAYEATRTDPSQASGSTPNHEQPKANTDDR